VSELADGVKYGEGLCGCVECFCLLYEECECWCCCGSEDTGEEGLTECEEYGHRIEHGMCIQCGGIRTKPSVEATAQKSPERSESA
jgi:hypothetical protein